MKNIDYAIISNRLYKALAVYFGENKGLKFWFSLARPFGTTISEIGPKYKISIKAGIFSFKSNEDNGYTYVIKGFTFFIFGITYTVCYCPISNNTLS